MRFIIHANSVDWQQEYLPRFVSGFAAHNNQVHHKPEDMIDETGVNVIFANNSWKLTHQQCINKHVPLITVGRCLFGSRFDMVAIGWDGFNAAADFCLTGPLDNWAMPDDRWQKHGWELTTDVLHQVNGNPDGYVLVCGEYRPTPSWIEQLKVDLAGEDVRFRSHPFNNDHVDGWKDARNVGQDNIHELFPECKAVVTYDSISGCDAVLAGVPTICYGENAMARDVAFVDWVNYQTNKNIPANDLAVQNWANRLAYCQWSHDEITSGDFWLHLQEGLAARIAKANHHLHLSRTTKMRKHHRLNDWLWENE